MNGGVLRVLEPEAFERPLDVLCAAGCEAVALHTDEVGATLAASVHARRLGHVVYIVEAGTCPRCHRTRGHGIVHEPKDGLCQGCA